MIVQCPSCASKYRVNDANVPSSGGKITCPSCQHKFIVYPEEQPAAQGGGGNDLEDKTSVAFRPDINKLVSQMRQQEGGQGGAAGGAQEEPPAGATEVMSGDSIPDFLESQGLAPGEDGTVEMQNPFGDADDVAATEVVSGDMLDNMGFDPSGSGQQPAAQQQAPPAQQPQQSPPPQQPQQSPPPQQAQQAPPAQQPQQSPPPQQPQQSPPAQSPPAAGAGGVQSDAAFENVDGPSGPDPNHDGPWKLKTNFGLTYEFPDTKSLSSWLSNREDLQGYELSGDGENFHGLGQWPQINGGTSDASASRQIPSFQQQNNPAPAPQQQPSSPGAGGMGNAGLGGPAANPASPQPAPSQAAGGSNSTGKKIEPQEYRPPSRDSEHHGLLWLVAVLLTLVAAAIAVQTFGIYDIKAELLGAPAEQAEQTTDEMPEEPADQKPVVVDHEEPQQEGPNPKVTAEVNRLVNDAKRAVKNNRLKTASDKLGKARRLDPDRVEVYEILAVVYQKMGQDEDAEKAKEQAEKLKASLGEADEVAAEEAEPN